jgi:hypothetical protein
MPNWAREGRIKDLLSDHGVQESDFDVFILEHRAGSFDVTDITPEWIAKEKERHPHRFKGFTSANDDLLRRAFVDGNITAQGKVVEDFCGGDLARANEIAARFGSRVGQSKPGTDPDAKAAAAKGENNPWSASYKGADAEAERIRLIRVLGTKSCASMAASAGTDIAGRPLRKSA